MPKQPVTSRDANILLEQHLTELGLKFIPEVPFCAGRRWRFDYVIVGETPFAIEIEGGIWTQGRHTRGAGYTRDLEKYRLATATGWKVYRFSTQEVLDGTAREFIKAHCL